MKKKVLFVIRELTGGGAERALSNIMMHFPEDWEIDLLMNNLDYIDFPYRANLLSLDIKEPKNRNSIYHQVQAIMKRARYLKKLKKENQYSACISFLDSSNISNILSGKKYCKTIISIRVSMTSKESSLLYRLAAEILMRGIYNRADKIVAVSREIGEEMGRKFKCAPGQITSIVNGYDVERIREQAKEKPENAIEIGDGKLVVCIGRLNEQKGQWHLIRAFSEVVKKEPNAKLLLLGAGDLKGYFEQLIERLELKNNVILAGYSNSPFWYCSKADAFVMPSMYEGFPNALAEAICCGVPCIATDFHSGAREILAPNMDIFEKRITEVTEVEYGVLTPLCSGKQYNGEEILEEEERQLAKAIVMLLSEEQKNEHYREQSKLRSKSLGIDETVQEWIRVIEEK